MFLVDEMLAPAESPGLKPGIRSGKIIHETSYIQQPEWKKVRGLPVYAGGSPFWKD